MRVTKNNDALRDYATSRGVRLWQVADKFGITDWSLSRKLRKEFSKEDAELFKRYVDEIASEGGDGNA